MRKEPLVGEAERRTLRILEDALAGTPYQAFTKVRLNDVLRADDGDHLWKSERSMLALGHLDFLVCERPSLHPVFAMEFDGRRHDRETQRSRDRCKNRLCWRADLPLLRITWPEIAPHERVSILEYMLRRFIAWPQERFRIEEEIRERSPRPEDLAELDPATIEDLADDPMFDPGFVFDITHRYPGNESIARRLLNTYGIEVAQAPGAGLEFYRETPLRCAVLPSDLSWPGDHVLRGAHFFVFEHTPGQYESLECGGDGYEARDARTRHRGHCEFSMRWTLPVDEEGAFVQHAAFADLPGIHVPHIARELSVYSALRDIEEWAERTLAPAGEGRR